MVRKTALILLIVLLPGCRAARSAADPQTAELLSGAGVDTEQTLRLRPAGVSRDVSAVRSDFSGPVSLEAVVQECLRRHGGVQAARKRVEAAARRVTVAGSLQDPMVEVDNWPTAARSPQYASGRMTNEVMVSQQVPWFGKRTSQASAAQAEVQAARAELSALELRVAEEARRAWYELYYTQLMQGVVQEDRRVLENLLTVAEARYETGRAGQQEVLRLQAEQSSVDAELLRLLQSEESARAELAGLLQVSPETELSAGEGAEAGDPLELQDLYERAVRQRPELQVMLAEIHREQHLADRARLDYYPDVTMRMGWGRMTTEGSMAHGADGVDNVSVGFGVNVPVNRGRLRASVHAAEAGAAAAARDYERLKNETQRDVRQLFSLAVSQRDSSELLRDSVIPKTEQALRAALRGYQVGATDFSDVIATWRELLKFHVAQLQMELQYRQTLASLERVVGGGGVVEAARPSAAGAEGGGEGEVIEEGAESGPTEVRGVSMLRQLKQNYRRAE
ncbi:MAG: TolC family protein [Planctomyces sp.]